MSEVIIRDKTEYHARTSELLIGRYVDGTGG